MVFPRDFRVYVQFFRVDLSSCWENCWLEFGGLIVGMSDNLMRLSKERVLIIGQSIVIAFLGFWMAEEYANNVFLQEYISGFWAVDWWVFPTILVVAGVLIGAGIFLNGRGMKEQTVVKGGKASAKVSQQEIVTSGGVVVMDVCPFCNVPLRVVGEDRYHCRKCKRYFKR